MTLVIGAMGRSMIDSALDRAAGYSFTVFPVVVTLEHGSNDGNRPWWWGVRLKPVADDAEVIIAAVLDVWRRDAPHPIKLTEERSRLRYSGQSIVWFIEEAL